MLHLLDKKNINSGFTLLELIIILVLASIVAAMASRPILGALKSAAIFQEEVDLREEAYYILTRMGQEVREGEDQCNDIETRADDLIDNLSIGDNSIGFNCYEEDLNNLFKLEVTVNNGEEFSWEMTVYHR